MPLTEQPILNAEGDDGGWRSKLMMARSKKPRTMAHLKGSSNLPKLFCSATAQSIVDAQVLGRVLERAKNWERVNRGRT